MDLGITISDIPLVLWYLLTLVVLEGLLSADNALVLAVMVRHLPTGEQKRALRFGLWGAFGFRLIAVLLSGILMRFWMFKVLGGLYLLYLSVAHFLHHADSDLGHPSASGSDGRLRAWRRSFWGTVVSVELADLAFSIDSILAAVGMAESLPDHYGDNWKLAIVYAGGVLGILTMRFVAGYFIVLLDRFSGLAEAAYLLVAWIGVKLVVSGLHAGGRFAGEIPGWLFWSAMLAIAVAGFFIRPRDPKPALPPQVPEAETTD
jgi:YkoY family integral membrane protein